MYNNSMDFLKKHRNDMILILAVLLLAGGLWLYTRLTRRAGGTVSVSVDGTVVARFPLDTDRSWTWEGEAGHNTLLISGGAARIVSADCPDRLCMNQGEIRYTGESLVCLPHKLVATVVDGADGGVDAVSV